MSTTIPPSPESTTKMTLAEIKANLRRLRDEKTVEQRDEHEAHIISFRFLSEVERLSEARGLTRTALAKAVGTSASYITQLFRGDRTLNLLMAARLQRVLETEFHIKAVAPISRSVAPEVHPVMRTKLPAALRSESFAQQQTQTGGQLQAYFTEAVLPGVAVDDFS